MVERKVAEFYHNMERKLLFGLVKMDYYHHFLKRFAGVLATQVQGQKSIGTIPYAINEIG